MKRLPQTLTAAVLTGALAFGGAAVAQAQESGIPEGPSDVRNWEDPNTTFAEPGAEEDSAADQEDSAADQEDAEPTEDAESTEEPEAPADGDLGAPAKTREVGDKTCYLNKDEKTYVEDRDAVNIDPTEETIGDCASLNGEKTDPEGSSELSDAAKAGIGAAIALPILGGIVHYFLNKDGKTWVKSQDRVNAEPTPEEKAESEKIVAEHEDEINAQLAEQGQGNNAEGTAPAAGESADSARGMSAETGSNSVAQALAALAVAAMVAAGAFAARRKFFA